MSRTLIFGAGTDAARLLARGLPNEQVVGLLDNDVCKQGACIHGHPVFGPADLGRLEYDRIRIASTETTAIFRQLLALGVEEERIAAPLLEPANRQRLAALKGRHAGRPAIIIGNGPSLRIADLESLAHHDAVTFAFNKIYLAYGQTSFRPAYYMVEDFLVAENNAAAIDALEGDSTKLFPETLLRWVQPDERTVLFGLTHRLRHEADVFFSQDPFDFKWGSSVVHTAIQWAFYMGCDPVYLIGVDFQFEVQDRVEGQVLTGRGEVNHFHPDYRPAGERWNRPMMELTHHAFSIAQEYAVQTGRTILNATRGGALDVFPRVDFDSMIGAFSGA